ncbi:MAG: glycerophosphodiester phosphodiesterase [Ignavibacteriae bacterium]|nr:glycerophosphodiester phosphodiesterase [Ignavibacteriota bacterium]
MIVAHRGSSGKAPENTLAAFRQAIDDGADMIELDVRMTRDFELVVFHDRSVHRITGRRGRIWELTLAELRRLDAGSWFGKKFSGERIPTLRQVIEMLPANVSLNIEVKTDGDRRKGHALEESLLLVLHERNFLSRAIVSSFNHTFLLRLHHVHPEVRTAVLHFPVRNITRKPSAIVKRLGAMAFTCSVAQLRTRLVDDIHSHHLTLGCYGVNTRRQLEKAMRFGVDVVITDWPAEVRKWAEHARRA